MDHTRHSAIFSLLNKSCTIIGAGGIGAITAITLAKMGMSGIRIFDDDTVDDVNLPTQFHKISDVGTRKSQAVLWNARLFSDIENFDAEIGRVTPQTNLSDWLVISAVDSINARKDIWKAVRESKVGWYFDARMASETFQLYTICMDDWKRVAMYEDILNAVNEEDVPDEPCTSKATMFTACVASGLIGAAIRRVVTGNQKSFLVVHDIFRQVLTVI